MNFMNRRLVLKTPALLASTMASTAPIGLLFTPASGYAQINSLPDAIEKAELLFMLSQRAAKAYFAIGLDVRKSDAQKVLDNSVQRFDRLLIEQKAFASTPAIKKTYGDLSAAWTELKIELIGKTPSKTGALSIVALNKAVFELSGTGSNQLQILAKTPNSKLQDVAGNVRMLSQRLSKNYFRKNWGVLADAATSEIQTATKSYLDGKAFLLAAPQTTAAIKAQIALANNQWTLVESAVSSKKPGTASSYSDVWAASENILSVMDSVCVAYGKMV
jgi:hypothetical protein